MPARDNEIGKARCPLCGGVARLRVSASGLSYLAMDCCKAQLFTRGDHSDTLARGLLLKEDPAPAAPAPAPKQDPAAAAPVPKPAPAAVLPAVKNPPAPTAPAPAPAAKAGWGWDSW